MAQPRPRPFLSSSRGAPFFILGAPKFYTVEHRENTKIFHLMCHQMPFWCASDAKLIWKIMVVVVSGPSLMKLTKIDWIWLKSGVNSSKFQIKIKIRGGQITHIDRTWPWRFRTEGGAEQRLTTIDGDSSKRVSWKGGASMRIEPYLWLWRPFHWSSIGPFRGPHAGSIGPFGVGQNLFRGSIEAFLIEPLWGSRRFRAPQGSVNGGFQTVVRVLWGTEILLPPFYLIWTPFLPQFYLVWSSFNLNFDSM